jgi:predicted GIY-YIG superfamily endonuclease
MKGFVYKITSQSTDKIYIGSTTKTLKRRLRNHYTDIKRNRSSTSRLILCYNDVVIECIEEVEFENKKELRDRERYHIEKNGDKCVNKAIPNRTMKEYYDDNAVEIIKRQKIYTTKNSDKIKAYRKQYAIINSAKLKEQFICECGGKYVRKGRPRHLKTKKHQNYIAGII